MKMKKDDRLFTDGLELWHIVLLIVVAFTIALFNVWLCQEFGIGCNDIGSPNCTSSVYTMVSYIY